MRYIGNFLPLLVRRLIFCSLLGWNSFRNVILSKTNSESPLKLGLNCPKRKGSCPLATNFQGMSPLPPWQTGPPSSLSNDFQEFYTSQMVVSRISSFNLYVSFRLCSWADLPCFFLVESRPTPFSRRVSMRSNATKNFASTMGKLGRAQLGGR